MQKEAKEVLDRINFLQKKLAEVAPFERELEGLLLQSSGTIVQSEVKNNSDDFVYADEVREILENNPGGVSITQIIKHLEAKYPAHSIARNPITAALSHEKNVKQTVNNPKRGFYILKKYTDTV